MSNNQSTDISRAAWDERSSSMISSEEMGEVLSEARRIMSLMVDYKDLRMMYTCALKTVCARFEVLDTEFHERCQHSPISYMTSRVKSNASIIGKMNRLGLPFTTENLQRHIRDIAGIRIICPYVDDIYTIAEAFLRQEDVTLLQRKDYIEHPKPNGYRSLHLIVSVPVFFTEEKKDITVEIQIRTIAMDFWASLEHQMKYKQAIDNQEEIVSRLTECAEKIAALDSEMRDIRAQIEAGKDIPTEDENLLVRMSHWLDPIETD